MPANDDDSAMRSVMPPSSEAHGHAALLLVESLIHGLCEKSTLTTDEAVEIVERAVNVQADQAEAADGAGAPMWQSHALLSSIATSLKIDGNDGLTGPRLVP